MWVWSSFMVAIETLLDELNVDERLLNQQVINKVGGVWFYMGFP